MLAATGVRSAIIQELIMLLPEDESIWRIEPDSIRDNLQHERYVFAAGVLRPKRGRMQSAHEINESLRVNFLDPQHMAEEVLAVNRTARICIVGSESGYAGSYDDVYASAKASMHRYVETKKLPWPDQQLVAVAPSIIEDAGMTARREDTYNVNSKRAHHPKKRFLRAAEVAQMIHFLLYVDRGYTSGCVVRMHGGGGA